MSNWQDNTSWCRIKPATMEDTDESKHDTGKRNVQFVIVIESQRL